ncbi:hypothetical protein, partial [Photobacterium leiognathi]|uniref:hypothetical protein n=1 Tax=Photobacterium leiognathi TaxID=553611 RepID=UPI002981F833
DEQLNTANTELSNARELIAYRESVIEERDEQLNTANTELSNARELIAYRESVIEERDEQLQDRNACIEQAALYIQDLEQSNAMLNNKLQTGVLRKMASFIEDTGNKK